jgi:hypothetical protein
MIKHLKRIKESKRTGKVKTIKKKLNLNQMEISKTMMKTNRNRKKMMNNSNKTKWKREMIIKINKRIIQ